MRGYWLRCSSDVCSSMQMLYLHCHLQFVFARESNAIQLVQIVDVNHAMEKSYHRNAFEWNPYEFQLTNINGQKWLRLDIYSEYFCKMSN